ncbi:MAG: hypothetical protein M3P30_11160 [Chloroflexota bacterium]|nr:hypothetical protein [Chloroflexota bacterium]
MQQPDATERTAYLDERKLLIDTEREIAQSFDKILTTLSAAALGLSITFIHEIAPHPTHEWTLACAWVLLGVSLLGVLVAHLTSQFALGRDRKILDERERRRQAGDQAPAACEERNWLSASTASMNVVALLTFVGGVGFLAGFSGTNLP